MEKPILIRKVESDVYREPSGKKRTLHKGLYRCSCGKEFIIRVQHINSGHVKSCGCIRGPITKHGLSGKTIDNSLYRIWVGIKQRCYNPKNKAYCLYGERGIEMSDEWKNSVETFSKDIGERPGKEYSVERIDNNKGYSKENCKWATQKEQSRNKRSNYIIEYKGEKRCLSDWAEKIGMCQNTLYFRLNSAGYSIEEAMTKPVDRTVRLKTGKLQEVDVLTIRKLHSQGSKVREIALIYNIAESTVYGITGRQRWKKA